jgi:hypothetical protein
MRHEHPRAVGDLDVDLFDARRPQATLGMRHWTPQRKLTICGGHQLAEWRPHELFDPSDTRGESTTSCGERSSAGLKNTKTTQ